MFSYLIVALFALLSLSVSSRPLPRDLSSLPPCDSPTPTPTPTPTTDDCSDTPSSSATPTASAAPATSAPPTTSAAPATSAPPTTSAAPATSAPPTTSAAPTTPVASTPATSPTPVSTSTALTTVSDASNGPFTGGVATYFYQNGNAGACGTVNSDYAMICAMDQTLFGTLGPASPLCNKQVSITNLNNGKVVTVTIADDCPTCQNEYSIDLSVGAFEALNDDDLSTGEFPISWSYI